MSKQTIGEKISEIKNEKNKHGNTKERVAEVLTDINNSKADLVDGKVPTSQLPSFEGNSTIDDILGNGNTTDKDVTVGSINSNSYKFSLSSTITAQPNMLIPKPDGSGLVWHDNDSIPSALVFLNTSELLNYYTKSESNLRYKSINYVPTWSEISGKPSSFNPSTHTHTVSEVTNLQTTLANKADLVDGLVPTSQLPSYVDDVLEYANLASFPATGESGKIYIALDTNKTYRWSGSTYVEITASPSSTDSVVEGTTNLYFTAARAQAAVTNITGNAGTATKLQTARIISVTGDGTGNTTFDGFDNTSIALTLTNSGVTAGTYKSVTVDAKGRVTAGSNPTTASGYGLTDVVTYTTSHSGDVSGVYNSLVLASIGTAGTYRSVTTDAKGRVISGTNPTTLSGYGITDAVSSSLLGANSGVATLDSTGRVPATQLPSYVDDVLEFANLASFPATGESGKIYIALDTNLTYRWGGSLYVVMSSSSSSSLALGETSSTAYRGDRGKIAYDHSQTTGNPHGTTKNDIGLGNVDNTSDLNKPISTATQQALNNKLDKGTYTGTAQDLKTEIDGKANSSHTHPISEVTNLQTTLDNKVDKVIGKQLSTEDYTTAEKNKLAGIQEGAEVNVNADWNATSGDAHILNKPSTFTPSAHTHPISQVDNLQTTLDGKESTISTGNTLQYWRGDKTWQTLDKKVVGLSNVDNTSDLNKPISTVTQQALNSKLDKGTYTGNASDLKSLIDTKADLVDGKVPKSQSQPSTMVMDNSTYVITFTDATGAVQPIDLPLESLFQDANYNSATKTLVVTLKDGTTKSIPLSDLVDLPEIVLATSNPAVTPTTGQKVYFNTSLGKVWFNVSGAWVFGGNLISDTEKTNLSTAYNHSQTTGNPHGTTKNHIGLGNVPNLDTTNAVNNSHTHSNKSILDLITEPFTTSLKSLYDGVVTSINNLLLTGQRLITSGEIAKLTNTSGTNTGDETTSSIQTKRPLKTIEGQSLEGSGNIDLTKNDIGLGNVDNTSDLNKPISTATQTTLDLKENVANKATDLLSPNNNKYPTTLAVANENKKATITVELISQLTTNFYAPNALRINSTALISGSGTLTLKVNDVAYTLGNLIPQGAKITAETTSQSVYNLISVYE